MTRLISLAILLLAASCFGEVRTANFIVSGPNEVDVSKSAEFYRCHLAQRWFGAEFGPWEQPAQVQIVNGPGVGQGVTHFVLGSTSFRGSWSGTRETLVNEVVPHEVMHMLTATHFKRKLPRFLDEGLSSLAESGDTGNKYRQAITETVMNGRDVSIPRLVSAVEYPPDIMPFYIKSHSLMEFLRWHGNRDKLIACVQTTLDSGWSAAIREHYGYESNDELNLAWRIWLRCHQEYPDEHVVARGRIQYGPNGWTSANSGST